ncbi:MAG: SIMPL domain-containing protein, partial [Candidatus Dormibacteria bacterium]
MSGVGTASVPPDRVEIWLQVVGEDRDKGRAYEKAARLSKRLV